MDVQHYTKSRRALQAPPTKTVSSPSSGSPIHCRSVAAQNTPVPSSVSGTVATMSSQNEFYYEGFSGPNGTIVPDDVFDLLAPRLKESELRVLLYIVRRTFGFGKSADAISLSQLTRGIKTRDGRTLDYGTGMSRKAVIAGVKGLVNKGIITVERRRTEKGDTDTNIYKLRFRNDKPPVTEGDPPGGLSTPPPETSGNYPGSPPPPPPGTPSNTQDSVLQDSALQDSENNTPNNTSVVASHLTEDQRLYEDLKALGIHDKTAAKLIRDTDASDIRKALDYLQHRLQTGWEPEQTPAAWLTAAIKNQYAIPDIPPSTTSTRETPYDMERLAVQTRTEFRNQRAHLLRVHDIEQKVDDMWQDIQDELRQRGEWAPVFAATLLRLLPDDSAELLIPPTLLDHLKPHIDTITAAINARTGHTISIEVKTLGGNRSVSANAERPGSTEQATP